VSPQASPADQFLGDDFHHNGAFRLSYGFEYVAMMETSKINFRFQFDRHDTYEWYLRLGALSNVDRLYFHGKRPTWNDFRAHPNYDSFWKKQAFAPYLTRVTVARKLYFHADGRLSFDPPPAGPGRKWDGYRSDPAHPVPYRPRPVTPTYPGPEWKVWMVEDQRFAHQRPDVLSWETEPLTE